MIYSVLMRSIPAIITVVDQAGEEFDCIYLSAEKGCVVGVSNNGKELFDKLPDVLKIKLLNHFEEAFSVPLEERGQWLKSQSGFIVEVT